MDHADTLQVGFESLPIRLAMSILPTGDRRKELMLDLYTDTKFPASIGPTSAKLREATQA